jgi:phospholipid/cholesterol/gamma-HCH transport system substrate-binding protein
MADHQRIDQVVNKDYDERVHHRRPVGMSNVNLGLIAAVIAAILIYLAFTKSVPFGGGEYQLKAAFDSSVTLRTTNPVRIAGVDVGEVVDIARKGDGAEVTFTIDAEGRPVNQDATVTIRPRLFLEGNVFLDLTPGSPSAPDLEDGSTIPTTQTAEYVQLDEVLTALQQDDREALSQTLRGFGDALTREPTASDDAEQDQLVRGMTAAQALNESFRWGGRAGKGTAQVSEALRGTEPGDLQRLLRGGGRTFAALADSEQQLRDLITNFNITAGALASEATSLSATLRELAPTAEEARPALAKLNDTLPPLREWARALRPGVNELEATVEAGTPWLTQGDRLLSQSELGGIARLLRRATPNLASATRNSKSLLKEINLISRCTSEVFIPAGEVVIQDDFATGVENYKEFFFSLAAQSGESQSFDGNGSMLGIQPSGGGVLAAADNPNGGFGGTRLFANTISPPLGTQPALPANPPPIRSDVPCHTNDVPDINGPASAIGPPSPEALP